VEFRILGPLEVLADGRQIDVGGAKQRALLAILLLHPNEVVSTERLIDALWEEEVPDTARKALQIYVSRLRKLLGRERIVTRAPGYGLQVAPGELDLASVQQLVDEGRPREALSLWRGPALSDFAYERFAQGEIARLEELRLACLEDRVEADFASGRHSSLVGELEALVAEHPLRERFRAQLMLALYRSGRQAEALDVYQDARRTLVDELGIEPGRSLRQLHQAILQQDPALDLGTGDEVEPEEHEESRHTGTFLTPERASRIERKTVTVVHVNVAVPIGRDEQVDPEVLRRLTTRAFAEVAAAVEARGGTIETIASDAVSAVFGLPVVHEDDPIRAVRAADEIQRQSADAADRLEVRVGVSTGAVVTGGGPTGLQLRATGEPFQKSARLALGGQPGAVNLDEATRRSVQSTRRDEGRFASPMVGRERERRRLHDTFEQAAGDHSCQLFTVLGAAGVGKSRLVHEFLKDLADSALVARGRCLPYGEGITFWPVLEAIREVAELDDTASLEDSRARLVTLIDDETEPELVAERVTEMIGLTEARIAAEEGFTALRRYFEALGRRRPLVVVFDDVHWGEATFLDLVEHLAGWSRGAPMMLLCMARPELLDVRPSWGGGKLNATSILLEPLSDHECTQLVANLVGEAELAEEVRGRIAGAADGNPLFVEEMLSMLIDEGLLVRENGFWAASGDLTKIPVPPTIQALLAARLDQLGGDERASIEAAAVEGQVFHEGSVAELAPDAPGAATALAALVRKELIRSEPPVFSGERAFRFRHLLIRDAAYESIPKESRATMHEQHVMWLEAKVGEQAVEFDEIVGYHLEQTVRYRTELGNVADETRELGRRAAERLGNAGRRAFLRGDAPAGTSLMSRAVALLSPLDPLRVELVPSLRAVQGISDLSWADRVLTEAVETAATTGDRRLAAHALVQRGLLRLFTDADVTPQELFDVSQRAIDVFEEAGDELGLARAWRLVAQTHYLDLCLASCADASEHALTHARRAGDRIEEDEVIEWLLIALLFGPCPAAEAIERCRKLLGEAAGRPALAAQVMTSLAWLEAAQGRVDKAAELLTEGRRAMDEYGQFRPLFQFQTATALMLIGDWNSAETVLQRSYEHLGTHGRISHFGAAALCLAQLKYRQGRYDEAEELLEEVDGAARANDIWDRIHSRIERTKLLARRGELATAEQVARETVDLAGSSDFLPSQADALMNLAEMIRLAGRNREADDALQEAIRLHEQKGNLLEAATARARLEDGGARA
jgi:DNA-binding SARP family transcriptional activator/tetratricopeptide (TPR) repeat protein